MTKCQNPDYPILRGIALTGFGGRPRVDEKLAAEIREEATALLAECARKDAALRWASERMEHPRTCGVLGKPLCQVCAALAEAKPAAEPETVVLEPEPDWLCDICGKPLDPKFTVTCSECWDDSTSG